MSSIIIFLLCHIFVSILYTVTSLPVTSKPIENTPEHLAWEAWIMVPTNHDKSRKITPKSIFIVPNATSNVNGLNTNNGGEKSSQIQCPPGHTVDNLKCIPTVNIDQSQILITRLTNLIQSTDRYNGSSDDVNDSYDYDYEYDMYEADESQAFTQTDVENRKKNSSVSDYGGEPLKINLSLEKFPPINQNKEEGNRRNNNKNMPTEKLLVEKEGFLTTTIQPMVSQTLKSDDKDKILITVSTVRIVDTTTPVSKLDFLISDRSPFEFKANIINNSKNTVPLLSSSETELLTTIASDANSTMIKDVLDYDLDDKSTTHSTTTTTEDEIELVTNTDEIKNVTLKDEIKKESLIVEESDSKVTTDVSATTETEEEVFTTFLNESGEKDVSLKAVNNINSTSKSNKYLTNATEENSFMVKNPNLQFNDKSKSRESFEVHDDAAPLMETVGSDKRFLYHHLGTTNFISNMQTHPKVETTTSTDVAEQLRIINQIVQENKKRAVAIQQKNPVRQLSDSKILFVEDGNSHVNLNHHNHDNVRSDFVQFPKDTLTSSSQLIPTHSLHKPPLDPIYPSDRFIQTPSLRQPQTVNLNSNVQQNSKPFWWLPTGWEVDRTGERPMMVHFWSRIPVEGSGNLHSRHQILTPPSSLMTTATTTTISRENSRSPTENLFKQEILTQQQQHQQQDIYSMLRAKQWKHNNR